MLSTSRSAVSRFVMKQVSEFSTVPFVVHSSFRDYQGKRLRPHGLEWGMDGDSHVAYLVSDDSITVPDLTDPRVSRGIIEAHNRWCFAKGLPFRTVDDIQTLSRRGKQGHVVVDWKNTPRRVEHTHYYQGTSREDIVTKDEACRDKGAPAEVWINGLFVSVLDGPETLPPVLHAIEGVTSAKLCLRRSEGLIRIERYFNGYLRGRVQVFDHVMDNLIALEDPQILDHQTLIGTATLPDWIMGGNLTSRLWIRQLSNGNVRFLRPLRNDDVNSSDRKFELAKGQDDEWIHQVENELERLRRLGELEHPFVAENVETSTKDDDMMKVKKKLALNRKRRKFFGM